MKEKRWLIAIGAGRWQLPGIQAARLAGLKVIAVDGNSRAEGLSQADESLVVDIRDASAVIAAILETGISPSGAIAFCNEAGMLTTAIIREHFGLPCAGIKTTKALTNKGVQRERWAEAKLPGPKWRVVRSESEVAAALGEIGGTVIFKPVDSAGSRGVSVIGLGDDWETAFFDSKMNSLEGEVIIEAFIVGVEHTVETFTHRGETRVLAVTSKKKVPGTHGTVASELESAQLDADTRSRVDSVVIQALAVLGYTDGPGHTELLLTEDGEIFLIEAAGRGGGFMVADGIVPLISGFDLSKACALQAVGLEPEIPGNVSQKSVVLRFVPSRKGTVKSVRGFGTDDEIAGVISEPIVKLGQDLGKASCDADRMAFILAEAESIFEARKKANLREQRIEFTIE